MDQIIAELNEEISNVAYSMIFLHNFYVHLSAIDLKRLCSTFFPVLTNIIFEYIERQNNFIQTNLEVFINNPEEIRANLLDIAIDTEYALYNAIKLHFGFYNKLPYIVDGNCEKDFAKNMIRIIKKYVGECIRETKYFNAQVSKIIGDFIL